MWKATQLAHLYDHDSVILATQAPCRHPAVLVLLRSWQEWKLQASSYIPQL